MEIVKWDKFGLGLGVILLIVAVALLVFWKDIDSVIIIILMVAGLISFITGLFRYLGYGEKPKTDEKTRKLSTSATAYSWLITLSLICILILLDYFGRLKMNVTQVLGLLFFVMLVTMLWMRMYFKRKNQE